MTEQPIIKMRIQIVPVSKSQKVGNHLRSQMIAEKARDHPWLSNRFMKRCFGKKLAPKQ